MSVRRRPVIDCHCHAGPGDGLTGPWDTSAPLGAYLRRARRAGIDRTVVFPAFNSDYAAANRRLAEIARPHGRRLLRFAMVHAARDAGRVDEMIAQAVRIGCRGIKVHATEARATREVCEAARRHRIPLLYDVAGRVNLTELIAPEYPDVDFIVPHLASFVDDHRAHQRLIDQMTRLPNVHADSSGVRRFDYLVQLVRRVGPTRLLFGSDGPWLHPGLELAKIRLLGLSPRDEALVLGGNLTRLLAKRDDARATPAE